MSSCGPRGPRVVLEARAVSPSTPAGLGPSSIRAACSCASAAAGVGKGGKHDHGARARRRASRLARAVCLAIDPARRLSQSLGFEEMTTAAQKVAPALFEKAGIDVPGSMTVAMLDTKSTFDSLIRTLPRRRRRSAIRS